MTIFENLRRKCGLFVTAPTKERPKIALVGVQAKVEIVHFSTRTIVKQKFTNYGDKPLEVKYIFPLEEDAAVCGFEAKIGKKSIKGKVQGREEAKQTYNTAVNNKQVAALLEKEDKSENVFVCEIGNLLSKETCDIKIIYVSELDSEGPAARFVFPTVVSNGYAPWTAPEKRGVQKQEEGTLSASQLSRMTEAQQLEYILRQSKASEKKDNERRKKKTKPTAKEGQIERLDDEDLPYELSLTADIQMPSNITSISTPSHSTKTAYDGAMRKIIKLEKKEKLTKEFVLLIEQEEPYSTRAAVEDYDSTNDGTFVIPTLKEKKKGNDGKEEEAEQASPESRVVQISFNREMVEPDTDMFCEVIFLVDVSGSMSGSRMEQTKQTLQLFLSSLPTNCIFNMVSFNKNYQKLFQSSQKYDDSTMQQAEAFVSRMYARGGTNIMNPLRDILAEKQTPGYPRQVFLLTDGEVRNTDLIVRMAAEHAHDTRIFTFGIGSGASVALCKGIARKSRGTCEMVRETEKISEQVMRSICAALQPPLCNTKVDWGDIALKSKGFKQVPEITPPVYPGRQFVYATHVAATEGKWDGATVFLKSTANQDDETIEVQIDKSIKPRKGTLLHVLAARSRIRELENMPNTTKRDKDEIRRLALQYNLASSETSFVAVMEKEDDDNQEERQKAPKSQKHVIPIAHGQDAITRSTSVSPSRSPARGLMRMSRKKKSKSPRKCLYKERSRMAAAPRSAFRNSATNGMQGYGGGRRSRLSRGGSGGAPPAPPGAPGGGGRGRARGRGRAPIGAMNSSWSQPSSNISSFGFAGSAAPPPPAPSAGESLDLFSAMPAQSQQQQQPKNMLEKVKLDKNMECEEDYDDDDNAAEDELIGGLGGFRSLQKEEKKMSRGKRGKQVVTIQGAEQAFSELVKLQKSDGSWELSNVLLQIASTLGLQNVTDETKIKSVVTGAWKDAGFTAITSKSGNEGSAAATLLALAILYQKFASKKSSFFLLAIKAKKFVAGCIGAKPADIQKIASKLTLS
mmetsp:Transcript_3013/g.4729  ORF Transcript_3013/g.4729 Transcript_3013/m.4729 type:complete len:1023 (-) Transcript_3013:461-3529(-)